MNNLKDTVTTICGVVIAISGAIYTIGQMGIVLPPSVTQGAVIAGVIATSVLAYFSGKNPNGTKKTPEQIEAQMKGK